VKNAMKWLFISLLTPVFSIERSSLITSFFFIQRPKRKNFFFNVDRLIVQLFNKILIRVFRYRVHREIFTMKGEPHGFDGPSK
jgi:hypothetical protein